MALVECKECGGKVSDKAAACPHCGSPVRQSLSGQEMGERGIASADAGTPVKAQEAQGPVERMPYSEKVIHP